MKVLLLSVLLIGFAAAQKRDGRCPMKEDAEKPTHLAHDTDCGKFLKCHGGNAYEISCPSGQHWNTKMNYCDSPVNAKCETATPMRLPPMPPSRPVLSPQRPNFPPRPEIEHPDYLNCPFNDFPGRVVYYPYHLNCNQFYQCVNGRAVL